MKLSDNARVAVVGGGPAGSMTGFFLLELAGRIGLELQVDLYESRNFERVGPGGCNMCAGVVSEELVQTLAAEGINLPALVVQRGIDAYVLHTSGLKPVHLPTPADDLRIASVYRGGGPAFPTDGQAWISYDGYLLELARKKGVHHIPHRVTEIDLDDAGFPLVKSRATDFQRYDLLVGAVGVNSNTLKRFESLGFEFEPPEVTKAFLAEVWLGSEETHRWLGSSMHVFLLDIPGLKFAALIPKAEYVTICLLGDDIDSDMVQRFMDAPEVRRCFPPNWVWDHDPRVCCLQERCHCMPKINVGPARHPFSDRIVMVGDSAVSRLYKDGIGAAYITAKAAAVTAVFLGVSKEQFKKFYWPVCNRMVWDNRIGKLIFWITLSYQKFKFLRRGMTLMAREELHMPREDRRMSRILWDTFTGSAPYRDIMLKSMHPVFVYRLVRATLYPFSFPARRFLRRMRKWWRNLDKVVPPNV